jgi:glutamate-1-semialdehyde 2,1-aminomutase
MRSSVQNLMPGGVSSPVRAFKSVGGEPIVFEKVKGAYAWDVDGNKYIDYVCTWGPSIVGHANDEVLDALRETLVKGNSKFNISENASAILRFSSKFSKSPIK